MTEHDKQHNHTSDDEQVNETLIQQQPVSIKAWTQKLLVAVLCVVSFYGGYKSYESRMVNQCFANGGHIVEGEKTLLCEL